MPQTASKVPPPTPALDREREARDKGRSQEIRQFLEWLSDERKLTICERVESRPCEDCDGTGTDEDGWDCKQCRKWNGEPGNGRIEYLDPHFVMAPPINDLLAEYFEIDQVACENERRALLKFIRAQNA